MNINLKKRLTRNFQLSEFLSDGDTPPDDEQILRNIECLANRLQVVRDILGRPITINSGYRSVAYNNKTPGASENSQHVLGKAADIVVYGMEPKAVQEALRGWSGGLGSYDTFTHVDIRPHKARW